MNNWELLAALIYTIDAWLFNEIQISPHPLMSCIPEATTTECLTRISNAERNTLMASCGKKQLSNITLQNLENSVLLMGL